MLRRTWRRDGRMWCSCQGLKGTVRMHAGISGQQGSRSMEQDADSLYHVGIACQREGSVEEAKQKLRRAAELGHAGAQATIGRICYDEMEAVRAMSHAHDYQAAKESEHWLRLAHEQGEQQATRTLVPLLIARGDLGGALWAYLTWVLRSARSPKT